MAATTLALGGPAAARALYGVAAFAAGWAFSFLYFSPFGVAPVWVKARKTSRVPEPKAPSWSHAIMACAAAVVIIDALFARFGVAGASTGAATGALLGGAAASAMALAYAFTSYSATLVVIDCAHPVALFAIYGAVIGLRTAA